MIFDYEPHSTALHDNLMYLLLNDHSMLEVGAVKTSSHGAQPGLITNPPPGSGNNVSQEIVVTATPTAANAGELGGNYTLSSSWNTQYYPTSPSAGSPLALAANAVNHWFSTHMKVTSDLTNPINKQIYNIITGVLANDLQAAENDVQSGQGGAIIFHDPLGNPVTANQFITEMNSTNVTLQDGPLSGATSASVAAYTALNSGGIGQAWTGSTITFSTSGETAVGPSGGSYDSEAGGVAYTVEHELGHASQDGQLVYQTEQQDYLTKNNTNNFAGWPGSPEMQANEAFANSFGADLTSFIGGTPYPNPGYGTWNGYVK